MGTKRSVIITHHMDCSVYHVPIMIGIYGNIKQFSGQDMRNILTLCSQIKIISALIHNQDGDDY